MMNSKSITRRYNSSDREAMCVCVCVVIISSIIIHSELLGELIGLTMNGFDIVVSAWNLSIDGLKIHTDYIYVMCIYSNY